jgi:branched-chain amino acid transport system permease protein
LVVMMIFRPEGLWPDERRREEQHEVEVGEEELEADKTVASTSADTGR